MKLVNIPIIPSTDVALPDICCTISKATKSTNTSVSGESKESIRDVFFVVIIDNSKTLETWDSDSPETKREPMEP